MALGLRNLFLLRDDVIFLNHGSYGACPVSVFEEYKKWQLELERQPVAFLNDQGRIGMLMQSAREQLATEVGTSVENLVCVTNATTGLNVVARSLPLKEGDEILSSNQEYAALKKPWAFISQKIGARFIEQTVPLPLESEEQFTEALWA